MTTTPLPPPMSDADREAVFRSLPDMLDGFLKTWGWLHFAKGIEAARDAQWQAYAAQASADLEAEVARLREALTNIVGSWDNNTFDRERFVAGGELGDYWSPSQAMVNSEFIAAARAALESKT